MQIIGVKFKPVGNIYDFNAGNLVLENGDNVIVETENGLCFGTVAELNKEKNHDFELKKVIRKATEKDKEQFASLQKKEREVVLETKKQASSFGLDMKIIDAEYTFDMSKLIITFTAEDRIDFRELVKKIASVFKTRIELRQVGARDEAKILGGLGPCGRAICCSNHLKEFGKVSIKMAKNQGLALTPNGINGSCGRLLCCLAYEDNYYVEALSKMPKVGSKVKTPDGDGTVAFNNVIKNLVTVKFVSEEGGHKTVEYALSEIQFENNKK